MVAPPGGTRASASDWLAAFPDGTPASSRMEEPSAVMKEGRSSRRTVCTARVRVAVARDAARTWLTLGGSGRCGGNVGGLGGWEPDSGRRRLLEEHLLEEVRRDVAATEVGVRQHPPVQRDRGPHAAALDLELRERAVHALDRGQ